jgi:hypothetical protein
MPGSPQACTSDWTLSYAITALQRRRSLLLSMLECSGLLSGRGSAWLERLVRDQEVGGSNPLAPIFFCLAVRFPPTQTSQTNEPTPVQAKAIPLALEGCDLVPGEFLIKQQWARERDHCSALSMQMTSSWHNSR